MSFYNLIPEMQTEVLFKLTVLSLLQQCKIDKSFEELCKKKKRFG
jgi:hypothetical protein